jgi:predicted DsbA family dithiol-disulfide isomerase
MAASGSPKSLSIIIYSDVICPWCYIGKHRLEQGLAAAGHSAEISWLPYELNPDMPEAGVGRTAYLDAKFGPGKRAAIEERLTEAAKEDGLRFSWDKVTLSPNTRKAHILIALGAGFGQANRLKGEIMEAYFTQGRDIGDSAVLVEIGTAAGLKREEILAAFIDPGIKREIERLEGQAHQLGVEGVPFFIINQTHALSGAQPASVWADVARKLSEDATSTT